MVIVGVALRGENIIIKLPRPNRHCNCFWYALSIGLDHVKVGLGKKAIDQGFYTHTGKYLNREQAAKYVKRIKQPTVEKVSKHLFSETMWAGNEAAENFKGLK